MKLLARNYLLRHIYINVKNKILIWNASTRSQILMFNNVVLKIYNGSQISVRVWNAQLLCSIQLPNPHAVCKRLCVTTLYIRGSQFNLSCDDWNFWPIAKRPSQMYYTILQSYFMKSPSNLSYVFLQSIWVSFLLEALQNAAWSHLSI